MIKKDSMIIHVSFLNLVLGSATPGWCLQTASNNRRATGCAHTNLSSAGHIASPARDMHHTYGRVGVVKEQYIIYMYVYV